MIKMNNQLIKAEEDLRKGGKKAWNLNINMHNIFKNAKYNL